MKKMFKAIVALALAATLVACGPQPQIPQQPIQAQQMYDQAGNLIQQAPQQAAQAVDQFDAGDAAVGALAGAAAGYMMGNASGRNSVGAPARTIIVDNRSRGYGYSDARRGSVVTKTTTVKRGLFGTTRTKTTIRRSSFGRRR